MRQGFKKYSDMQQSYFLNSTSDMAINKRQRHATLAFLEIDRGHGDPPSRAPVVTRSSLPYTYILAIFEIEVIQH